MKSRTKWKLKFYLSLVGLVTLTVAIGVLFQYLAFCAWTARVRGFLPIKYELFMTMAAISFVMCITDIYLFFYLIMKRKY